MKAQVLTLENVLFFSLGIILVLMVYFTFTSVSEEIRKKSVEEGVIKTATYLSYVINKVYRIGNITNSSITLYVSIPEKIGGEIYRISSSGKNLFVILPDYNFRYNLTLYGIEVKLKYKQIPSSKRGLIIEYSGGKVEIR